MNLGFRGLVIWGVSIGVFGMLALLFIIPWTSQRNEKNQTKTEFFSARASYWCVISGLILIMTAGLGVILTTVISAVRH